ncbi:hypothetical protein SLE2022_182670 [Rubroshorea leprosula]
MAETVVAGIPTSDFKITSTLHHSHDESLIKPDHDETPTVDYSLLNSNDLDQRAKALQHLAKACEDYGFFYLINGVPEDMVTGALKAVSDFFDQTTLDERGEYKKKNPTDRFSWVSNYNTEENRECLKVVSQPQYHCPSKPAHIREILGEYLKRSHEVELGLARALSKILGMEETFIEKAFKLQAGFDVTAMNFYPPSSQSKGPIGLPDHTDPGLFVSLIQDVNGGLQILSQKGEWISVKIPPNAIFINFGDQIEILTNGRYKSNVHDVVLENNKVRRISMATLHGPALEAAIAPETAFVNQSHPPAYPGMTYKEYLEFNGFDEIDVQSSITQLRLY